MDFNAAKAEYERLLAYQQEGYAKLTAEGYLTPEAIRLQMINIDAMVAAAKERLDSLKPP